MRSSSKLKSKGRPMASFNGTKSMDFSTVENEYIRNLQQQIYYLELECEHLRDQNQTIVSVPTKLSLEAERMIRRIKEMQAELKQREYEIVQKESAISMLQHDKANTQSKLQLAEETFTTERKELINEIVCLKKQVERYELDATRRKTDTLNLNSQVEEAMMQVKGSDNKVNILSSELNDKMEQFNKLRVQYEEKRAECLKLQTEFQELEERFFHSKAESKEEVGRVLKDEIKNLRYDVREKELQAEQDRTLRLKISDDCGTLIKENSALSSQVIDLQKQLDMERQYKVDSTMRKQANIQQLVSFKEDNKQLEREMEKLKEKLYVEQKKYRNLLDKYTREEDSFTRVKLEKSKLKAELEELEGIESTGSNENIQLRRDKQLLTDEVIDLKTKLREYESEVENLRLKMQSVTMTKADLESKLRHQTNFDQIRWEEFERMAEDMKQFSRSMSPIRRSLNISSRTLDLDS